jgi:hypothetical protein
MWFMIFVKATKLSRLAHQALGGQQQDDDRRTVRG